jgi:hypothetical protein
MSRREDTISEAKLSIVLASRLKAAEGYGRTTVMRRHV